MPIYFLIFLFSTPSFAESIPQNFQSFFKDMVAKNNTQLGAVLTEAAAKERQEGGLGLYMPTLTSGYTTTSSKSPTSESESRALSVGLSGNVPQLGLNYSSTLYSDSETVKPTPVSHSGSYNFTLSVNLLKDFGPTVGTIPLKSLDLSYDLAKLAKLNTIYGLFRDLLSSYAGAYAAQKNLSITIDSEIKNKEELRKSTELFKAGKIPKLSLLSLQSQSLQIQSQVMGQQRSLRESFKSLYTLAAVESEIKNIPYESPLAPIEMPFFDESKIESRIKEKIDFETLKNPDYLVAKIGMEQAKYSLIQSENAYKPTLSLAYTVSGAKDQPTRSPLFPNETKGNVIALNFSMPIGMVTEKHSYEAAKIDYRITELGFLQTKRKLERDWTGIVEQYGLLKQQLDIAKLLAKSAKEKYEVALPTASLGPTYQQNVIGFQNEMIQTQLTLNQLQVDLLVAQFQILAFHSDLHIFEIFRRLR